MDPKGLPKGLSNSFAEAAVAGVILIGFMSSSFSKTPYKRLDFFEYNLKIWCVIFVSGFVFMKCHLHPSS